MTDPDGLDIEIINQHPATPAANGRPPRPAFPPGLSHVGLVILDCDKERTFYGDLLGGQLVERDRRRPSDLERRRSCRAQRRQARAVLLRDPDVGGFVELLE